MKPDPKLALSALETEQLRAMRARVGKLPPTDAALGVLGRSVFEVLARVGLTPADQAEALTVERIVAEAPSADVQELRRLLASLQRVLQGPAAGWRAAVSAGAPQAILTRRLVLGGREAPRDAA
jgi:hypothetical protein